MHPPVSPGEILLEEFMKPLALSANALARALRVPPNRIAQIIRPAMPRGISADTALRLARYFATSPEFWLNLQSAYDLACEIDVRGDVIERDVQPREAAAQ